MVMNNLLKLSVVLALMLPGVKSLAQDKGSKEEKPPVFNYVIDDPMDKFQPVADSQQVKSGGTTSGTYYNYFVPEFYFPKPKKVKDTTYEFFCYDVHDSLIKTVTDYDSVFYYSLYKSYPDYYHNYTDNNGNKQYLPVSSIMRRYDKVGKDKWMTIEYPGNKFGELRAFRNVYVAKDTVKVVNQNGDNIYNNIYHYYKLIK